MYHNTRLWNYLLHEPDHVFCGPCALKFITQSFFFSFSFVYVRDSIPYFHRHPVRWSVFEHFLICDIFVYAYTSATYYSITNRDSVQFLVLPIRVYAYTRTRKNTTNSVFRYSGRLFVFMSHEGNQYNPKMPKMSDRSRLEIWRNVNGRGGEGEN